MLLRQLLILIVLIPVSVGVYAADVLSIDDVVGNAGESDIPCFIHATHDLDIEGFSVAIQHDPSIVTMTSADFQDTAVATLLGGGDPDFAGLTLDSVSGIMQAGVIFGYGSLGIPPTSLQASPSSPNSLMRLLFTIDSSALPQDVPLQFIDGIGSPPIDNLLSAGGVSVIPGLIDGTITVNNLHRFFFGSIAATPGGNVNATVRYDHADSIQGFQISLTYDNSILTLLTPGDDHGWYNGTTMDAVLPGGPGAMGGIELFYPALDQAVSPGVGLITFSTIFDFLPPYGGQVLPAGPNQSLIQLNFQAAADPALLGTTTEIVFDDSYLLPSCPPADPNCTAGPALNYVIYDGLSITPILESGLVEFVDQPGFKRGNSNGDANVDLGDSLYIVNWLFSGGPQPTCMDSCDTNDDGGVDISDCIFLLNYLFVSGPPPAAPGPSSCGVDPTSDSLDCTLSGGC